MNDTPPVISEATAAEPEDWTEVDDLPVAEVRGLFIMLGKALRAFQLYDDNNPVRKRFVTSLREAFEELWREVEGLNLSIEEHRILLVGEEVYKSSSRSDSLAFLLYKDGIRDVTFLPGVEGPEVDKILGVLQRAKMLQTAGADDLLTMLWEADLQYFSCRCVDQITEGAELPTAQAEEDRAPLAQVIEDEAQAAEDGADGEQAEAGEGKPPPPKIGQDFSPTLYALDPDEKEHLQRALASEMSRDLRHDVLAALFDRLEEDGYPDRKSEILKIFRELLPSLLSRGAVEYAATVLEELAVVRTEPGILDEVRQQECDQLLDDLSSTETIQALVEALQDGTIDVPVDVLARLLRFLRASALPALLGAAEREEIPGLKDTLRGAVHGIAKENPEAVMALLDHADPVVTSGAVRLIGRMEMTDAAPKLARLMVHPVADVRLALIETAELLRAGPITDTLVGALSDVDGDVRMAAARALATLGIETAVPALEALVTGKEIRQADLSEKIAIFESYGLLGGAGAADVLKELLNKKGFLGRREPSQIRASAARALGRARLPGAQEALRVAEGDADAVVRTAVRQALEGIGEETE